MRQLAVIAIVTGCASSTAPDPGLEHLTLSKVAPQTIIPGTTVIVAGDSFVDEPWGTSTVHLVGQAGGPIDVHWPATFVDFSTMKVAIDGPTLDALGGDVDFKGTATLEVVAMSDGDTYASAPLDVSLSFRNSLAPMLHAPSSLLPTAVSTWGWS